MNNLKWYKINGNGELVEEKKLEKFLNEAEKEAKPDKYIELIEIIGDIVNKRISDTLNNIRGCIEKNTNKPIEDTVFELDKIDLEREYRSQDYTDIEIVNKMINRTGEISVCARVMNSNSNSYLVSILKTNDGIYGRCNCEDFEYRGKEDNFPCKHIIAVCRSAGIKL